MSDDFDPDADLDTQEQYDAYVRWCGDQFQRIVEDDSTLQTYRTAIRAAAWLLVVAQAQIHLHDDIEDGRDMLLSQLSKSSQMARCYERQHGHVGLRDLIVGRSVLDCWEPSGQFAMNLLDAARHALSALILYEVQPLNDIFDELAPDMWSLILMGAESLTSISEYDGVIDYDDYAVVPNQRVIAKMNWQKVNAIVSSLPGAPPISPN